MNFDGTLSPELAMMKKNLDSYNNEMRILAMPAKNDGTPMPAQLGAGGGFCPKGGKNTAVAKDFMKYFIRPEVMNENLKGGLGRWCPSIPQVVKDDPWWTDPKLDPHRSIYVNTTVIGPSIPNYVGYNPAIGQVNAEQLWGKCHADVIKNNMTPAQAVDKAFKRAETIFKRFDFS